MQIGLHHITHPAVQLVRVKRDRFRCAGRVHSGDRGFTSRGAAPPDPEHRGVSREPSRGQRDVHIGHQMLRRLKRRNRSAELSARQRVVNGALQHRLADADQVQR
jgi:hypothetical protein